MTEALASPVAETSCDEARPFLRVQTQFSDPAGRLLAHAGRECALLRLHTFSANFTKHEYRATVTGAVPRKLMAFNRARKVAVYNGMCNAQSARELAS